MRLVDLDVDLVRAFVTVVDCGSVTHAGRRLGRTQPAVSMQLKRLSEKLHAPLFAPVKAGQPLRLTDTGERILGPARDLLAMNDRIIAEVVSDAHLVGEVRLGAPEEFASTHLVKVLKAFTQTHPEVAVSLVCDFSLQLMDKFRQGSLDLVLLKTELNAAVDGEPAWREPLVWVAADMELVGKASPVPLCVRPSPCLLRKRAIDGLEKHGRKCRVAYSSPSLVGLHAALRASLGITALPLENVPEDLTILPKGLLPALQDVEYRLIIAPRPSRANQAFAQALLTSLLDGHHAATIRTSDFITIADASTRR